jgi:serine/threonine protein kinase
MQYSSPAEVIKLLVEACPAALQEKAKDGLTPLHLGIQYTAPVGVVELMVEACPAALQEKTKDGLNPLHSGMENNAPAALVKLLVEACPAAIQEKNKDGWTPLHLGMQHKVPVEMIKLMVEACPAALQETTKDGWTLLHLGMQYAATLEVIQLLLNVWPDGVHEKAKEGRIPLHAGIQKSAPLAVIQMLVETWPDSVRARDTHGNIALHLGMQWNAPVEVMQLLMVSWSDGIMATNDVGKTPDRLTSSDKNADPLTVERIRAMLREMQCSACTGRKPPSAFSKQQRKKPEGRRCTICVAAAEAAHQQHEQLAKSTKVLQSLLQEEDAGKRRVAAKAEQRGLDKEKRKIVQQEAQVRARVAAKEEQKETERLKRETLVAEQAVEQAREVAVTLRAAALLLEEQQRVQRVQRASVKRQEGRAKSAQQAKDDVAAIHGTASAADRQPSSDDGSFILLHTITAPVAEYQSPAGPPQKRVRPVTVAIASSPSIQPNRSPAPAPAQAPVAIPAILELDPTCLAISPADILGAGSFATVRGGVYTFPVHGATPVAVKIFHGTAGARVGKGEAAAVAELLASTRVSMNPNLVHMYGAARLADHGLCLVMERIAGLSLRLVLDDAVTPLPWELRSVWLSEIAAGMDAMHQHKPNPVLHRDLKASNVLLDSSNVLTAHAKIADFGVAKAIDTLVVDTYSRGAREWTAPETLHGTASFPSDVYSFGVLLFEVLSRVVPFANRSGAAKDKLISLQRDASQFSVNESLLRFVTAVQQRDLWVEERDKSFVERRPDYTVIGLNAPPALVALMHECWKDEPSERPDFTNITIRVTATISKQRQQQQLEKLHQQQHHQMQPTSPVVNIYTICRSHLAKANIELEQDSTTNEKASDIFVKDLAGTMETLFKQVCDKHHLRKGGGASGNGLGTYFRMLQDSLLGAFDPTCVQGLEKLIKHRNLCVHEDMSPSLKSVKLHALTCEAALSALEETQPM